MLWGPGKLHRMYIEGLKGAPSLSSVVGKDHTSNVLVLHNAARVTVTGDRDNLNFRNTHQSCITTPRLLRYQLLVCSLIVVKQIWGIALRVAVNVPLSWADNLESPKKS